MNLATILKDYPALIPAFATLLVAVLGYFFVRWNSTHNKNLEIQKKEYDRRASTHDMRIKEARDYINTMGAFVGMLEKINVSIAQYYLSNGGSLYPIEKFMEELGDSLGKLALYGKETEGDKTILTIIDDKKLLGLQKSFKNLFIPTIENMFEILQKMEADSYDALKTGDLKEFAKYVTKAQTMVTKMKIRLDELAKKVK